MFKRFSTSKYVCGVALLFMLGCNSSQKMRNQDELHKIHEEYAKKPMRFFDNLKSTREFFNEEYEHKAANKDDLLIPPEQMGKIQQFVKDINAITGSPYEESKITYSSFLTSHARGYYNPYSNHIHLEERILKTDARNQSLKIITHEVGHLVAAQKERLNPISYALGFIGERVGIWSKEVTKTELEAESFVRYFGKQIYEVFGPNTETSSFTNPNNIRNEELDKNNFKQHQDAPGLRVKTTNNKSQYETVKSIDDLIYALKENDDDSPYTRAGWIEILYEGVMKLHPRYENLAKNKWTYEMLEEVGFEKMCEEINGMLPSIGLKTLYNAGLENIQRKNYLMSKKNYKAVIAQAISKYSQSEVTIHLNNKECVSFSDGHVRVKQKKDKSDSTYEDRGADGFVDSVEVQTPVDTSKMSPSELGLLKYLWKSGSVKKGHDVDFITEFSPLGDDEYHRTYNALVKSSEQLLTHESGPLDNSNKKYRKELLISTLNSIARSKRYAFSETELKSSYDASVTDCNGEPIWINYTRKKQSKQGRDRVCLISYKNHVFEDAGVTGTPSKVYVVNRNGNVVSYTQVKLEPRHILDYENALRVFKP